MSDSDQPLGPLTPEKIAALARRLDELEAENERLRERVEELEERPVVELRGGSEFDHLFIGEYPLGKISNRAEERSKKNEKRIDALEGGEQRVNPDALDHLLPINRMLHHLSSGREDEIPTKPARRATRLYQAFVRRASGKTDGVVTVIDATNNTYSLSSGGAKEILEESGDITKTGKSVTVSRAMRDLESLSRREGDEKPLVEFDDSGGTNYVVVNKEAFHQELGRVQRVLEGGADTDDPSEQDGEATVRDTETRDLERDAEEEFDRLLE